MEKICQDIFAKEMGGFWTTKEMVGTTKIVVCHRHHGMLADFGMNLIGRTSTINQTIIIIGVNNDK